MIRKIYMLFTCVILFTGILFIENTFATENGMYGDVDSDGDISMRDALKVLLHVSKTVELTENQSKYADVSKDGSIDVKDALQIMKYTLGQLADFKANETEASGVIWIAGDSIAAPGNKNRPVPQYGWGEVIGDYFTEEVTVNNMALGGRSSKSFVVEANYQTIMDNIKPGDYLLISFGHNDCKTDETRYTNPVGDSTVEGSFRYILKTKYVEPALEKGAVPVLLTSVIRCSGNFDSIYYQSHSGWATSMRLLSEEYAAQHINVPCIKLFNITYERYYSIGKPAALELYHSVDENNEPDSTHYNEAGARWISKIIVREMQALDMDIAKYADEKRLAEPDPDVPVTDENIEK